MIDLRQRDDVNPVCPHCQMPIAEVWFRELKSTFGKRYVYFCSQCQKVLGVTHRKGFWMG